MSSAAHLSELSFGTEGFEENAPAGSRSAILRGFLRSDDAPMFHPSRLLRIRLVYVLDVG